MKTKHFSKECLNSIRAAFAASKDDVFCYKTSLFLIVRKKKQSQYKGFCNQATEQAF
jgi:hypothetical protein